MRYYILLVVCLLAHAAGAQVLKGIVADMASGKPLSTVTVVNTLTQQSVYTSEDGEFAISAKSGERLVFSIMGYKTAERLTPPSLNIASMRVEMVPLSIQLDELVVKSGYTDYQRDSAERRGTYSRVLARQKVTSIMSPVSLLADKISRKSQSAYAFQRSFNYWENQLYIDSRYTPQLVGKLTGLTGDTLAHFMNANPMPLDYARTATELELKMWIRDRFKHWTYEALKPDSTSVTK